MQNYYQALGLKDSASKKEIRSAYWRLAKKHHPDHGGNAEIFKKINEAYSVLTSRRSDFYDRADTFKPEFRNDNAHRTVLVPWYKAAFYLYKKTWFSKKSIFLYALLFTVLAGNLGLGGVLYASLILVFMPIALLMINPKYLNGYTVR